MVLWLIIPAILGCAAIIGGFFVVRGLLNNRGLNTGPVTIPRNNGSQTTQAGGIMESIEGTYNISVRLSEGQPQPQAVLQLPETEGVPLLPEEVAAILARVEALTPAEQAEFRIPPDVLPPPRPGQVIESPFPAADIAEITVPAGGEGEPLQVSRYAPQGEIPIAPFVNITFNQPMVPLGTLQALAAIEVPVRIEPELPGTWRWLGTKTLTFEYDSDLIDRLPKATEYRVTIPAGTKSATGGVLAEDVIWTFSTPPAQAVTMHPSYGPQPLEPVFFILFDQRISPEAVLETIRVDAGSQRVGLRLATQAEVDADEQVSRMVKTAGESRWLAFKAIEPLPADTGVSVSIGPGTPSAEGPRVTLEPQSYSFSTYAPLRIDEHGCAWYSEECRPLTPLYIRFNNPIDETTYRDDLLTVTPEIPGVSVNIFDNTLQIEGATRGQTTYTVVVNGEIQDVFGQKLGRDERLTFRIGKAEPVLVGPEQVFLTLDPAAEKKVFSVYAINYPRLEVEIYAVRPADWPAFRTYMREWQRTDNPPRIPGRRIFNETMPVEAAADALTQVDIDLGKHLDGPSGHFVVMVRPPTGFLQNPQENFWRTIHAWVQVTQIGLDAYNDHSQMLAMTTALTDGAPLSGVKIQAGDGGLSVLTGEDGTARFDIPSGAAYLTASLGADTALLPRSTYFWDDSGWNREYPSDSLRWYVFDDRQMYRPGEEVHVKGWMRKVGGTQSGDVGLAGSGVTGVVYNVVDPQYNNLLEGQAPVNALGGFDFVFTLPEQINLGEARVVLSVMGNPGNVDTLSFEHAFQVQEFRRPEFEVVARNETSGPYFAGGFGVAAVDANYYAGGALPDAEVNWQVTFSPGSYAPPKWPEFIFGTWQPWWWYFDSFGGGFNTGEDVVQTFAGKTDAAGTHYLRLDFDASSPVGANPRPYSVVASASVMDVNRQAWASSTAMLVHPADLYIGLRSQRYFVERGDPIRVDFIVTDLDGNPVSDRPVEVRAARLDWKLRNGNWQEEEADVQTCTLGSQTEPVTCSFETSVGGSYRITAVVTDAAGRRNQSQITRWVSGGEQPPARKVEQETVNLIPDQETYQPGDVARILVQPPFTPAEGLLTVSRSGTLYTERFRIEEGTKTLEIPIRSEHIPNLNIQVDLTGSAPRTGDDGEKLPDVPPRPAYASGTLNLSIPPLERSLKVDVSALPADLEPGGDTQIAVQVLDAQGLPVADAELAVVVVDEAILALSNYQLADPLSVFYSQRPSYLMSTYGRASIVLVDPLSLAANAQNAAVAQDAARQVQSAAEMPAAAAPEAMMEAMPTAGAAMEEAGQAQTPIRVRTDFNPLAAFAPAVRTDANGQAVVAVKLPDNLTRYRVMVAAVEGGRRFGTGESNLTARLPLMVRPSAPRFLNFGDVFELPVVLQNQTGEALLVNVAARASNLAFGDTMTITAGIQVSVPAHDRVEVRFPTSTSLAGTARIQLAAVSGAYADAATVELPVYTPATSEAFAVYGVVDQGAVAQPLLTPEGVFPQYGGLEITTSSTALQALTDAVLYLVSYPFECSEQLASRILGVAALRDVLTAFQAEGLPSSSEMESAVQRDIDRLQGLQNGDGGFPYWRRGFPSIPFNTIHVAHALYRAQQKGFNVPTEMQSQVLEYLRNIENYYPHWYSQQTRRTLSSYAVYVRDLMGDSDPQKALRLLDETSLDDTRLEIVGWLWPVLIDQAGTADRLQAIRTHLNNRVVETAGAANFTTEYDDQTYLLLSSNRRTDAILLDALILDNPQSDLIPKLVNGLLGHRIKGHWGNTQEDVFVLLALDRYFNTFEAQTPDFVARIWLGETYAGSNEFRGRSTDRVQTDIPMSYLTDAAPGSTQNLVISKEGDGRLYYRLGLRYAPTDLKLPPLDMGFVVSRVYEAVDDPADVSRDENGTWHIRAGAKVRVRVTMVADNRRYHVALVDPLPAGLEIVNPALAVSVNTQDDPNNYSYGWWWWNWTWYEHQNLRDQRAEVFTSLLWDGVYEYTYYARATTPGTFVVPPAKAEEMYSPEVFGRSGGDVVIVK